MLRETIRHERSVTRRIRSTARLRHRVQPVRDQFPVFEMINAIGYLQERRTVRDDDRCPLPGEEAQRVADPIFGLFIQGGGGFVEDQHGGILQKCTGDCNSLTLSFRERAPSLTDDRIVARREA